MIPTEANYAEWFTCSARYYLLKEGYAFFTFGVGQVSEPGFPSARLLAEGSRLVGLVFCTPVDPGHGQRVCAWKADPTAHEQLASADWIVCALPLSADPLDQQLAHQKVLFPARGEIDLTADGILSARSGATFKQMFERVGEGTLGLQLPAGWSAGDLATAVAAQPASLYLVVNRRDRIVFALYGGAGRTFRKGVSDVITFRRHHDR